MKIFFDKLHLPVQRNMVVSNNQIVFTDEKSKKCDLYFGQQEHNHLNSYLSLFEENSFEVITKKYFNIIKELKIKNPNWKFLLKESEYAEIKSSFKKKLSSLIETMSNIEYSQYFSEGNYVLNNLENIVVDVDLLKQKIKKEENPTLRSIISSFLPKSGNTCSEIEFNRLKTTTGRLVVSKGPQILLLPKDMRRTIVSRYGKEGSVLWVDFVSLEPRFTKLLSSNSSEVDIYSDILKKSGLNCSRKKIKLAVLATLFGAGMKKLIEILDEDAFEVRKSIKKYFNLDEVLGRVGDFKRGKIKNYFGRNIFLKNSTSNVALNNYIQSSCVDISLIGFSSLLKDSNLPKSVKPIAVVHDALVVDIKNSDLQALEEIINKGININKLGKFYLGFESYE